MNISKAVMRERLDLAWLALGGKEDALDHCQCDPSVGCTPCQQCALYDAMILADYLLDAVDKMSHRKCHACGHVEFYIRDTLPWCKCWKCGSEDTRLIR